VLISLREIVAPTVRRITALGVAPEQQPCVAGNASSLAEALFNEELWYRAVQGGLDLVAHVVPARPG
jgi:hypothetical protein